MDEEQLSQLSQKRQLQMKNIQSDAYHLFCRKNKDYGDAFAKHGTIGVLIRMQDKIQRGISVSNSQITLVDSESLRDTLIDLHNYSAMAIMLLDDEKNSVYPGDYNGKKRKQWGDGRWFNDAEMYEDSRPNAWE